MLELANLAKGAPVEWLRGDDYDLGLRRGHPGRVLFPNPEDVIVEWVGVPETVACQVEDLGHLTEHEFEARAARVRSGGRSAGA